MEKESRNILGPTIKLYRKKKGITQECLTESLKSQGINIDRTIIAKIENQTRELYDYEIYAISKVLEIDYNSLFNNIAK